jgi:hypothetical protein
MCLLCGGLVCTGQWLIRFCVIRCYVSVMWKPGMHRAMVDKTALYVVMCLLYGGLVCTGQWLIRLCVIRCNVSVMWRPGVHRSIWLRCQVYALGNVTRQIGALSITITNLSYSTQIPRTRPLILGDRIWVWVSAVGSLVYECVPEFRAVP